MSKAMSLKAKVRNIAKEKNIPAQVILQNYMFERLLVRLSASKYKHQHIWHERFTQEKQGLSPQVSRIPLERNTRYLLVMRTGGTALISRQ